ncbi:MAG: PIG-L family deacetylase [Nitrospiraceae bacterium]|nr:PIG-L family deacetylase [Nitrospiraceae bacterium]
MSTLVSFHAHPDDECMVTGGTIARAASEGHRVVLVVATGGEMGEYPEGFVSSPEELAVARREELARSAEILGVSRVVHLAYRDSGMAGTEANQDPRCFARADVTEAARRLAALLGEEGADALTVYDANGGYGHPDHIMVHRVGMAAARMAGVAEVFQATMNRDHMLALIEAAAREHPEMIPAEMRAGFEEGPFGTPAAEIDTAVDVSAYLGRKLDSLKAHASQIGSTGFALQLPEDAFAAAFSTEWFISSTPGGAPRSWLL